MVLSFKKPGLNQDLKRYLRSLSKDSNSEFSINSGENPLSLFALDCLSNQTKLFYIAKVVDSNSTQYIKSTPNDIIYEINTLLFIYILLKRSIGTI